jgi:hypothetical protein
MKGEPPGQIMTYGYAGLVPSQTVAPLKTQYRCFHADTVGIITQKSLGRLQVRCASLPANVVVASPLSVTPFLVDAVHGDARAQQGLHILFERVPVVLQLLYF